MYSFGSFKKYTGCISPYCGLGDKHTYDDASELDIEPILPARLCCEDGNGNEVVLGATSTDL